MSKDKELFEENPLLSDDEVMEEEFYGTEPKKRQRPGKKNKKSTTKPRSFDEPVEKIAVELPKRLVKLMRVVAAQRDSRFNIQAAAAFEMYLKDVKSI